VLRGTAVVHLPGGSTAAGPGDCIHLPARVVHAVENTGAGPLELLGVFRPAGSPSEAYYADGTPAMSTPGGAS
jgi:mannose-6-phosphate isomerase-like protein (cupin superfamily)